MLLIIKPFQKKPLYSRTQSPCFESVFFSISSPGFQKSSPGFFKHESGFFSSSSPGPDFSRVRIFFESETGSESESGPGFEVCRSNCANG